MKGKDHSLILGILFVAEFAIYVLMFLFFVLIFGIQAVLIFTSSNADVESTIPVFIIYGAILFIYFLMAFVLGITGWKLLKQKPNARVWGIIASICSLPFFIPLGLLIMIYGLWFCLSEVGKNYFLYGDVTTNQPQYFPPQSPNQWQ